MSANTASATAKAQNVSHDAREHGAPRHQLARWTALVAVVFAAPALLIGCANADAGEVRSVDYSQYQAIAGFDSSVHTTTDPARLAALTDVLDEHDQHGDYDRDDPDGCPGAISTDVEVEYTSGETHSVAIPASCSPTDFESAMTELVTGWRESDG